MIISLVMQMTMAQSWLGDIGRVPAAKRDLAIKKSAKKEPLTKERSRPYQGYPCDESVYYRFLGGL